MKKNTLGTVLAVFFMILVVLINLIAVIAVYTQYVQFPNMAAIFRLVSSLIVMGGIYTFYLKEKMYVPEKKLLLKDEINSKIFIIISLLIYLLNYGLYYGSRLNYFLTNTDFTQFTGFGAVFWVLQVFFALIFISFIILIIYLLFSKKLIPLKYISIYSIVVIVMYALLNMIMPITQMHYFFVELGIKDIITLFIFLYLIYDNILAYILIIIYALLSFSFNLILFSLYLLRGNYVNCIFILGALVALTYIIVYTFKIFYSRLTA